NPDFEMRDTTFQQPCHALVPHAFSLEAAEQWALERASRLAADRFRITSFWHIDCFQQQVPGEIKRRYIRRVAQAENYGIAVGLPSPFRDTHRALVGEDSREVLEARQVDDDVDRTALIDLLMANVSPAAKDEVVLDHTLRDKHALRSRLFADETDLVLQRKGSSAIKGSKPHVLVIGTHAGMIGALVDRGFDVSATDMSPDIVDAELCGVKVHPATENAGLIEAADLAIITGMTLANRTLPPLIAAAKAHNTSTVIWAITGRNFGQYYVHHGVDCVISDHPSPFLSLPGRASVGIWRREL
ncbi:MAG TPA: DUF364 domain-containing protein, partial [Xanthobacteraceae bacterium]